MVVAGLAQSGRQQVAASEQANERDMEAIIWHLFLFWLWLCKFFSSSSSPNFGHSKPNVDAAAAAAAKKKLHRRVQTTTTMTASIQQQVSRVLSFSRRSSDPLKAKAKSTTTTTTTPTKLCVPAQNNEQYLVESGAAADKTLFSLVLVALVAHFESFVRARWFVRWFVRLRAWPPRTA